MSASAYDAALYTKRSIKKLKVKSISRNDYCNCSLNTAYLYPVVEPPLAVPTTEGSVIQGTGLIFLPVWTWGDKRSSPIFKIALKIISHRFRVIKV